MIEIDQTKTPDATPLATKPVTKSAAPRTTVTVVTADAGPLAPLPHDPLPPLPLARLYLTGDLRAAAGISRTHMDYYLREGLVRPTAKTAGGYLLFDEQELQLLRWIIAARAAGGSLKQIRERLGR